MEIVLLIVLAGVWLFFLLPSFMTARRTGPIHSTERFARTSARLGSLPVRATSQAAALQHRARQRRRRVLVALSVLAAVTLLLAIATGSWAILFVNLLLDALLATYVALMIHMRDRGGGSSPAVSYADSRSRDVEVLAG